MSDLTRLRELAVLLRAPVAEAQEPSKISGIEEIVHEAIDDIAAKVGKGGALEAVVTKADVLDIAEDTLNDLDALVKKFKVDFDKLMLEIAGVLAD